MRKKLSLNGRLSLIHEICCLACIHLIWEQRSGMCMATNGRLCRLQYIEIAQSTTGWSICRLGIPYWCPMKQSGLWGGKQTDTTSWNLDREGTLLLPRLHQHTYLQATALAQARCHLRRPHTWQVQARHHSPSNRLLLHDLTKAKKEQLHGCSP